MCRIWSQGGCFLKAKKKVGMFLGANIVHSGRGLYNNSRGEKKRRKKKECGEVRLRFRIKQCAGILPLHWSVWSTLSGLDSSLKKKKKKIFKGNKSVARFRFCILQFSFSFSFFFLKCPHIPPQQRISRVPGTGSPSLILCCASPFSVPHGFGIFCFFLIILWVKRKKGSEVLWGRQLKKGGVFPPSFDICTVS